MTISDNFTCIVDGCSQVVREEFIKCTGCCAKHRYKMTSLLNDIESNFGNIVDSDYKFEKYRNQSNQLFSNSESVSDFYKDCKITSKLVTVTQQKIQSAIENEHLNIDKFNKNIKNSFTSKNGFSWKSLGLTVGTLLRKVPEITTLALENAINSEETDKQTRKRKARTFDVSDKYTKIVKPIVGDVKELSQNGHARTVERQTRMKEAFHKIQQDNKVDKKTGKGMPPFSGILIEYHSLINTYENFLDASQLVKEKELIFLPHTKKQKGEPKLIPADTRMPEQELQSISTILTLDKQILQNMTKNTFHQKRLKQGVNSPLASKERNYGKPILDSDDLKLFYEKKN